MENEIRKILVADQTPVVITKIVEIINSEKAKTKTWQTVLAFFIVVFIGFYCIHIQVNHGNNKQESCAEKDSVIKYKDVVIGVQKQYLDSAIFLKDIK